MRAKGKEKPGPTRWKKSPRPTGGRLWNDRVVANQIPGMIRAQLVEEVIERSYRAGRPIVDRNEVKDDQLRVPCLLCHRGIWGRSHSLNLYTLLPPTKVSTRKEEYRQLLRVGSICDECRGKAIQGEKDRRALENAVQAAAPPVITRERTARGRPDPASRSAGTPGARTSKRTRRSS